LHDYFQAELPTPWPAWRAPAAANPLPPRSLFRSRFGLAASVAVLLGSQLWLAGFYRAPESSEAAGRSRRPVDVASKPQVSNPDGDAAKEPAGGTAPVRPVLKNMR
jgi:hypothetical protein